MPATSRLTSSGSQLVNDEFDEVSMAAGSISFNGTSQYLTTSAAFNTAMGGLAGTTFTIETWVYITSLLSSSNSYRTGLLGTYQAVAANGRWVMGYSSATGTNARGWFAYTTGTGSQVDIDTTATFNLNSWNHLAVTIDATTSASSTIVIYVNGVGQISTAQNLSTQTTNYSAPSIGGNFSIFLNSHNGYVSNMRIVKGTLVYTGNFVPSQSMLPSVDNTLLLLNTINSTDFLKDNSPNNFTLTNTGTATYNVMSPFGINTTGSISFNGSQYLTLPSNQIQFTMGTGDFTIEMWVYITSLAAARTLYDTVNGGDATGTGRFSMQVTTGGVIQIFTLAGTILTSGGTLVAGTWYHIAYVKISNSGKLYLNGTQVNSTYTDNNNYVVGTTSRPVIGINGFNLSTSPMLGSITNLRVVKGTGVYTAAFTPAGPLYPITNTSLLLNVTSSASLVLDSSVNNFTVTNNGTATFSSFIPSTGFLLASQRMTSAGILEVINQFDEISFTPGSWTLTGTSGAVFGTYSAFALSGDFTVEFFFYVNTSVPSTEIDFWESQTTSSFRILKRGSSSGLSYDAYGGTSYLIVADASIPANSWNHVAVSRTGTTVQAYFNGTRTINQTDATSFATPTVPYSLGCRQDGTNGLIGSISNFRLIKGTGVYTGATITVPTAPLGNITNTQLLLSTPFTGGAFFDFSTNNFLVTKISTVTSASTSPFTANTPQRLTNTGVLQVTSDFDELSLTAGAVSFDGTNDYLSMANSTANQMGTGDWTAEAWIYITSYSSVNSVFAKGGSTTDWFLATNNSNGRLCIGVGATSYFTSTGSVVPLNTWCHVALVRSGTTLSTYFNGILDGTVSIGSVDFTSTGTLNLGRGRDSSTNYLEGSISNARLVKGTAVYTANFTPPQSILPSITNTQLLLNVLNSDNFITDSSPNNVTLTNNGGCIWTASGPFNS